MARVLIATDQVKGRSPRPRSRVPSPSGCDAPCPTWSWTRSRSRSRTAATAPWPPRSGIELVLELAGFDERLPGAELVVTGEGSLDEQTLHGRAVAGVASQARSRSIPVVAVCGRSSPTSREFGEAGISAAYPLTGLEPDVGRCMEHAAPLLERSASRSRPCT